MDIHRTNNYVHLTVLYLWCRNYVEIIDSKSTESKDCDFRSYIQAHSTNSTKSTVYI
jgi:hypothetical protein